MKKQEIVSVFDQSNLDFFRRMAGAMDLSFKRYGDYKKNYQGEYTEEFLKDFAKTINGFIGRWKDRVSTTANGNAILFALTRLALYAVGGKTRQGYAKAGNIEYLTDAGNGIAIEADNPQVPGHFYKETDYADSPGFFGMCEEEIKAYREEFE